LKAFLLAAGHGTRLRPLTDTMPKCLVPIRGVPLLEIWLQVCRRAGIDEVLINLHAHADLVREALAAQTTGITVHLLEETTLLGSAGTLFANRDWVAAESNFWVLYADVLTAADLSKMASFHREGQAIATLGLYQVNDPSRCGVVTFDDDYVVRQFVEKPAHPASNWAFSGLMIATPELLHNIPERIPADLGFDVLPHLAGRMRAYPITEFLLDIGTLENYHSAQDRWPGIQTLAAAPLVAERQCSKQ
jgi:mannose-1-phosphate guanylyltransferase